MTTEPLLTMLYCGNSHQDNFEDLGYTYSRPTIALLNDGRWAAITGNGDTPEVWMATC